MDYQERLMLLADGFRSEIEALIKNNSHLGEDAQMAILGGVIEKFKESIVEKLTERLKENVAGTSGILGKTKAIIKYTAFTKELQVYLEKLIDLAGDIAMDDNFKASGNETFLSAITKIIDDEHEIRGL